jgi:predicted CoA-binding protein
VLEKPLFIPYLKEIMGKVLNSDADLRRLLENTKTVALVGASPKPNRPSHGVMAYLQRSGYRVIPVNPMAAGSTILGETVYGSLTEIKEPIDMIDVFRRAEDTPPIAEEAVAVGAKSLWLQLDIVNDEAAAIATKGGLDVVMDRCTAIEIGRLL